MWLQKSIRLASRPRGFHLITQEIVQQLPELADCRIGLLHLFVRHTSASLTINENADPTVRHDMEAHFHHIVPEHLPYFRHTLEGPDDMPAHIKASLLGCSVTIPVRDGRLALGTWQGIWFGEHREHGGERSLIATLNGETQTGS
ncbi:MAG TPA: secondary thiamine-phosphate synthase enzyme YjbQ [Mariprofundaceae bacterium]|nr:secondary thiamine-phosphate synthase enzyme YjbQ [Mariprofundaceae bacterium]